MCKSRYLAEKHKGKAKYCPVLAEYCSLFVKVEEVRWCKRWVKILFWQKIHIIWMDILVAFYLISLLLGCN